MILSLSLTVKAICVIMNKSKMNTQKKKSGKPVRPRQRVSNAIAVREPQKRPVTTPAISAPRYSSLPNGDVRITRREYIKPIESDGLTFSVDDNYINPGKETFKWLSQVADNYEEYVFEKLSFEYKPVISSATYSGAMGSVIMAMMYNAGSANLDTFAKMVEYSGAIEKRVCDPIIMRVNVSKNTHAGEDHYIRTGNVPSGEDIKSYDIGKLLVAIDHVSTTFPSGTLLGHIYADYTVVLKKPKLKNTTVPDPVNNMFGNWCCYDSTVGDVQGTYQQLSVSNIRVYFDTDVTVTRKLILFLPYAGRFFLRFQCSTDVSASIGISASTGFSYLDYSGVGGALATSNVHDTITPFSCMTNFFFQQSEYNSEIGFLPSGSANLTGWNCIIYEIPEGSLSWGSPTPP